MVRNYLEIIERANTGSYLTKNEWDYDRVMLTTRNLVEKYELKWEKDRVIPDNPKLVDRVFEAGLELAKTIGIYSLSTERVLRFDSQELEEGLKRMPTGFTMGTGKDARWLYARQIVDRRNPIIWAGNPGVPTPEATFLPNVMSWMQEPIVDLVTCGSMPEVDNYAVRTGEPAEIIATRRELSYMREGLRRVGRPGMGMLAAQSSVSELGDLAVAHPDYLRTCDSHLVAIFNELIIDKGNMARAANSLEYGMYNASLATVMIGGLAGDAPGAAVVQVASFILANMVCLADYHLLHPIHIRHVATSTRGVMWVQSVVSQAFARNAPAVIVADIYPKSGAVTKELLYEVAANSIVAAVSGAHLEGVGSADGALPHGTGLEARWMGEVGHAVARQELSLSEANALVLRLLDKYEYLFASKASNPGLPFQEAYDLQRLKPIPKWQQMYCEVREELCSLGLPALA